MLGSRKTGNYLPNKRYPIYAHSGSLTAEMDFWQSAPEFDTNRNRSLPFLLLPIPVSARTHNIFYPGIHNRNAQNFSID
jgi:hypothetical protein